MLKEQKGITLIALVITIIVLLILAGVTIAMLTGENGILNRATTTKAINAEAQAEEQAKLAYMAVRTEIAAKMVEDGNYDAEAAADDLLTEVVQVDLKGSEWACSVSGSDILMKYTDASLEEVQVYGITLTEKSASWKTPTTEPKTPAEEPEP